MATAAVSPSLDGNFLYTLKQRIAFQAVKHSLDEDLARLKGTLYKNVPSSFRPGDPLRDPGDTFASGSCPIFDEYSESPKGQPAFIDPKTPIDGDPVGFKVGIVGGGMGGLYTALILVSLGIRCEILEATDRPGGRVWTYKFPPPDSSEISDDLQQLQYYDVGAMRFPDIPIMKRTFDLFADLGMEKNQWKPGETAEPAIGDLIPYYWVGPNNPFYFNNILCVNEDGSPDFPIGDAFNVAKSNGGLVPDSFVDIADQPVKEILKKIFDGWKENFANDFDNTWGELLDLDASATSLRSYMISNLSKWPEAEDLTSKDLYYVTNWCETMDTATTHYDESFISLLLHSLEFDYPSSPQATTDPKPIPTTDYDGSWWCVNGGSSILPEKLLQKVRNEAITTGTTFKFVPNARVTKIEHRAPLRFPIIQRQGHQTIEMPKEPMTVSFTPEGSASSTYSHVITTTTAGCLGFMDLRDAGLDYSQREAIRVLRYDNSVKVGIQFKTRWWAEKNKITIGGIGKTDRPTRVVVYPSYALATPQGEPGVLLACYNWAQDAARLGSLMKSEKKPTEQEAIYQAVIADLALMHDGIDEETLRQQTVQYHVHDWYRDENTNGAFGMFGPAQFPTLFGRIQRPAANGRLFMAGEITSIYHGWIVAALNSAVRAIDQMLLAQWVLSMLEENYIAALYCFWKRLELLVKWGIDSDHEPAPDKTWIRELYNERGVGGWQVVLGIFGNDEEIFKE